MNFTTTPKVKTAYRPADSDQIIRKVNYKLSGNLPLYVFSLFLTDIVLCDAVESLLGSRPSQRGYLSSFQLTLCWAPPFQTLS